MFDKLDMPDRAIKNDEDWRKELTPEQYAVLRERGTEAPWTGKYAEFHGKGVYKCAACGRELFSSDNKYDSGTGWPSFYKPIRSGSIEERADTSHGLRRTEVVCSHCGGHLGHLFYDGPDPTGLRYCINSVAVDFLEKEEPAPKPEQSESQPM